MGYLRCSTFWRGISSSQQKFVGSDPPYFERIFTLEAIEELVSLSSMQ